jgi:tryptophan synthase alpha chain
MSRISGAFRPGQKALIGYLTVGYPSVEATVAAALTLAKNGCDILELGIPFSDPLADGATIQQASFRALGQGVTPLTCLEVVRRLRRETEIPLLFMTYFNPVASYGLDLFCRHCAGAGVNGLILPDLPVEEGTELEKLAGAQGVDLVYLLAPTSTGERIRLVAEHTRGFLYLTSVAGVTGARDSLPQGLGEFVARVRQAAHTPVCVGFGIASARQAGEVAKFADGVIVGSRFIQLLEKPDCMPTLACFTAELRAALDKAA